MGTVCIFVHGSNANSQTSFDAKGYVLDSGLLRPSLLRSGSR